MSWSFAWVGCTMTGPQTCTWRRNLPTESLVIRPWSSGLKSGSNRDLPHYVMEATGVYYESLAYFLDEQGCQLSVVLPNKIANYVKTLEVKTITDATASRAITQFGLERKLDLWKRPKGVFKKLRQLTRERDQIVEERTMVKNQLHAEQYGAEPNKNS